MKRKLLSVLLTFCLAFSLLPTAALADEGPDPVAQIGEKTYATLKAAFEAAQDGDTVTLLRDAEVSGEDTLDARLAIRKAITLNLNDKTINSPDDMGTNNTNFTALIVAADVTINATTGGIKTGNNGAYAINVMSGATLTINGGTYYGGGTAVQVQKGTLIINDGHFSCEPFGEPYGYKYLINCIDKAWENETAKVFIKGGTFVKFDPSDSASEKPNGNFLAEGYGVKQDGDNYIVTEPVAAIGDTKYPTLAAAITAANNDTVTLLKDVAYATNGEGLLNITKSITLDGNGHSISGYGARGSNKTTLAINHTGSEKVNVTLKNLTINNDGVNGRAVETRGNIGELTVDNCKFNCTGSGNTQVLTIGGNQSGLTNISIINKSELNAGNSGYPIITFNPINLQMPGNSKLSGYCGIYFKGVDCSEGSHKSVVTAKNCSFDCPNVHGGGSNDFGVFALEDDNITITLTDCSINAEVQGQADQAVLMASGSAARHGGYSISICGDSLVNGTLLSSSWGSSESNKYKYMITGGYFTSDPSDYCAEGYRAGASDKTGYEYKVVEKKADENSVTEVIPSTGDTTTKVAEGVTVDSEITTAVRDTTATGLAGVAMDEAAGTEISDEKKAEAETALNPSGSGTISYHKQVYLDVTVNDVTNDGGKKKIDLDITAMSQLIASTEANPDNIDLLDGGNAVKVGEPEKVHIDTPVTISIPLPATFANVGDTVYIQHKKIYEYAAAVTAGPDSSKVIATFTNPHGFSEFVIAAATTAVAQIDDVSYLSLQAAVDAVTDGQTIKILTADQTATVSRVVKFTVDPDSKTYTIGFGANYSDKDAAEHVYDVVYTAPSGGGGGGSSTYSVSAPTSTKNGSVTVSPKSASKGDTVTVTVKPDSGYVLETLTVTDKNGNELTLKDKGNGKYTFTMPAGKVEVKATFMEDNSMLNFFYDVPNNAYFYEAVKWAVENGITDGVGNDLFAPEQPCTRAQIVTFLWRAAGSPEPKGAASGMTDVVSGSYYEKAVAWAIENGITTGTTTSMFSPDVTCTRAQAVTFLARALSAKAASAAEFSDVPTDSYFADAVAWAAANGVTEGIGGGLFGSDNDCTRGQIVTFLYRAYNK